DASGAPVLVRPFTDAVTHRENGDRISFPGALSGGVLAAAHSQLWGADLNGRLRMLEEGCLTLDVLAGFRFLSLDEGLAVSQSTNILGNGFSAFAGTTLLTPNGISITDSFATHNRFYGGQLGARGQFRRGALVADVIIKMSLGGNDESVSIAGSTSSLTPTGI